jgi:hypothetical protein
LNGAADELLDQKQEKVSQFLAEIEITLLEEIMDLPLG